ncbi:unnamed protein product, partial [Callosobruchus maculatus]
KNIAFEGIRNRYNLELLISTLSQNIKIKLCDHEGLQSQML